ncbi:MAG: EAL domain-containing protein [Gemmatirosa sp.]|nr:EAL domain-containing protein [Gemmatirosa sp.]
MALPSTTAAATAAAAAADASDATDALMAREHVQAQRAMLSQSVRPRYLMMAVGAMAAVALDAAGLLIVPLWEVLAVPGVVTLVNYGLDRRARARGEAAAWHFWLVVALDALGIAASTLVLGTYGYLCMVFFLAAVGGYALASLPAARVQLAIACGVYPIARATGTWIATGRPIGVAALIGETVMLAVFGWLAIRAPARQTFRVRRARRALADLEHGAFDVRLPTRASDDLGFLAASFNRTAETLGRTVHSLQASEARLVVAERDARTMANRMQAVAVAASGVLAADSLAALQRVLGEACRYVMSFDGFTFATGDRSAPAGFGPAGTPMERAVRTRRSVVASQVDEIEGARSTVCSPVLDRGTVVGVIAVECASAGAYDEADVAVLEAIAALAATALRNIRLMDELRGSREALAHQAHHDPLTDLANRARMRQRVEQALASEHAARVAVLALDLDGFKTVNDSLGHAAGDAVLVEVAARLLNATRGGDTVARLGGDEFGILLENAHSEREAEIVAERVITALQVPFVLDDRLVFVGGSVGIARATAAGRLEVDVPDDGAGDVADAVEALLRDADTAMYHAKARGKGQFAVFEPRMHAAALERLVLEIDLRAAIEREEFTIAYQPIVGLVAGQVEGVEALIRWMHPTRGAIAPGEFIPLAESTGLILPIGRAVLRAACRQGAAWQTARGGEPLTVTVNVSGRQLEDAAFVDDVAAAIAESGIDPRALVLELTESTIAQQPEVTCERLHALKALGIRLAIDDFGTGYSSLAYLQQFPIDVLKIDKSFVDNVTRGGPHAALARTIVALAEALSVKCVAEGVEEMEQRVCLSELGCVLGQGYHFARPMSAAAVAELLGIG